MFGVVVYFNVVILHLLFPIISYVLNVLYMFHMFNVVHVFNLFNVLLLLLLVDYFCDRSRFRTGKIYQLNPAWVKVFTNLAITYCLIETNNNMATYIPPTNWRCKLESILQKLNHGSAFAPVFPSLL
jgi:hypothetical protein